MESKQERLAEQQAPVGPRVKADKQDSRQGWIVTHTVVRSGECTVTLDGEPLANGVCSLHSCVLNRR